MKQIIIFICCMFTYGVLYAQFLCLEEKLAAAILENNHKEAKRLLKDNPDINFIYKGNPLLNLAIRMNNTEMARILVEKGASIMLSQCDGVSPLFLASTSGSLSMLQTVLGRGFQHDLHNALLYAISGEKPDHVGYILNSVKPVNYQLVNKRNPYIEASKTGNLKVFRLLEEHEADLGYTGKDKSECLLSASMNGHDEIVQYLANKELSLLNCRDSSGNTPLHISLIHNYVSIIRLLTDMGADLTATNNDGLTPFQIAFESDNLEGGTILLNKLIKSDKRGFHPKFMDAVSSDKMDWVKSFVETGMNPDTIYPSGLEGYSVPLVMASALGYQDIVEYLIDKKVDLDRVDLISGETALTIACKNYHIGIAETLLNAGCNPAIPAKDGSTALTLALHNSQREIINLLLSGNDLINEGKKLDRIVDSLHCDLQQIFLHVKKSRFILSVVVGKDTLKQYNISLGQDPVDDKIQQGDGCTPEGSFRVITKYPHEKWSRFIYFNYPNEESWRKFNRARAEGTLSDWAQIGGEIGIHGVPPGCDFYIDERYNWTQGCISLRNADIEELYEFVREGTRLIIYR